MTNIFIDPILSFKSNKIVTYQMKKINFKSMKCYKMVCFFKLYNQIWMNQQKALIKIEISHYKTLIICIK